MRTLLFSLLLPEHTVEQTVELSMISDAMPRMRRYGDRAITFVSLSPVSWHGCGIAVRYFGHSHEFVIRVVTVLCRDRGCFQQDNWCTYLRWMALFKQIIKIVIVICTRITHQGRVTHICISKQTIIGTDNGLLPGRRQAIISTNSGILSFQTLGTNFSEILSEIPKLFKKIHLNMSSAKWRQFCLGFNVIAKWSLILLP